MIVGILGPGGCGGTFLDWTLQFLYGSKENVVVQVQGDKRGIVEGNVIQSITQTPIAGATAHGHKKTHPTNDSLPIVINNFLESGFPLNTFYYVDEMSPSQTQTDYNSIIKTYPSIKFISYEFSWAHIDLIFCLQYEKVDVVAQSFNNQVGNLLSTGELRERLSLFYPKCIKGQILNEQLDNNDNLYLINFDDVWRRLDTVILDIFEFLDLPIDKTRYLQWLSIYRTWIEKNKTNFFDDLPKILDCIVSGNSLDLSGYDITFAKEVVLASKLLYNYNLALKFDGVNDLRNNTLQWHSILEKNIYHNLEDTIV